MQELLNQVEKEVKKRNFGEDKIAEILSSNKDHLTRRIIAGYASVDVVDREGQRIPVAALNNAAPEFMEQLFYRNLNVFHCLAPETQIRTTQGFKRISEVHIGDLVYTHTGKSQKVLKVITHENDGPALKITLENGEVIRVTSEHPILTKRGWVKAGELKSNDVLLKLESRAKEYHNAIRGKSLAEILGKDGAARRVNKISHPKSRYTLTKKHNSQTRKCRTWSEVYGHAKPNYGGCAGENNPMFGRKGCLSPIYREKNGNWKDGASFKPYSLEFNEELKEIIRKSSAYKCSKCGISQEVLSEKLIVHHIDEDKMNSSLNNLVAVCRHCHAAIHNKTRFALHNGTCIKSIEHIWYSGFVYNLEVDVDHTYAGKGIIYHNSDVTLGRILPKWTNPDTGETVFTHVDDKGWFVVAEIRDDLEIADKAWKEVLKGNIRSFSIAGSSKEKLQKRENGAEYEQVNALEIYEVTLCEVPVNQLSKFEVLWNPERVTI